MDQHQQKAFDMLRSPKIREAFDLSKEDPKVLDRYGKSKHPYGGGDQNQSLLIARRLIEAGTPFVHVDYQNWDWHGPPENVTGPAETAAASGTPACPPCWRTWTSAACWKRRW